MKIRIQKNELAARTSYDFRRLEEKSHLFLPCKIEEERDAVSMNFDLQEMKSFEELKEEDINMKLTVLLQAAELKELYRKYEFSLDPGNLYYDMLGRVKVKSRDIISSAGKNRMKHFLEQYQALIGYILAGTGSYSDYLSGGLEFLTAEEKTELVMLMQPETVQEEKKILSEYYSSLLKKDRETMRKVERKRYSRLVRYSIVSSSLVVILLAAFVYVCLYV